MTCKLHLDSNTWVWVWVWVGGWLSTVYEVLDNLETHPKPCYWFSVFMAL